MISDRRIQKFDSNGNFICKWTLSTGGGGRGIFVNSNGYVYIANRYGHCIEVYKPQY